MNYITLTFVFFVIVFNLNNLYGQEVISEWSEDFINQENLEEDDDNDFSEQLAILANHPINLNSTNVEELSKISILSAAQIIDILEYIEANGKLVSIYELQAINSLDLETIKRILPFVKVNKSLNTKNTPLYQQFYKGDNEAQIRWQSLLENQKGYKKEAFEGSKDKLLVRFRHSYANSLSYGITMEKDAGEGIFSASNPNGFDFNSAHLFLKNPTKNINSIAIGDYRMHLGQGLNYTNHFGAGKNAQAVNNKLPNSYINAFRSSSEIDFLRGISTDIRIKKWQFLPFISHKAVDANVGEDSTSITSIQTSGLHRTINEIADEKSVKRTTTGLYTSFGDRHWKIGNTIYYENFSKPLNRSDDLHNNYRYEGNNLFNIGVDYHYFYKNTMLFGELSRSKNNGLAILQGISTSIDRKTDVSIIARKYDINYESQFSRAFAESTLPINENGLYLGIETRPNIHWKINAYADIWKHPWLRFNVDGATTGSEYLAKINYSIRRKLNAYLLVRHKSFQKNRVNNDTPIDILDNVKREQYRINIEHKITKGFELRNRFEHTRFNDFEGTSKGWYLSQDFIFAPMASPWHITGRLAYFNTDDYDSRIYAYENDIIYSFLIPAYFQQGIRAYVNVRYKFYKGLTLEGRYSISHYTDVETIGSGNDEIDGSKRQEVKAQIIYRF